MARLALLLALLTTSGKSLSLNRPASLDVLLQVRLKSPQPANLETWLMRRSFAAVLPMQPMLVLPLEKPQHGVSITFRRKPSSEKGGQDGGIRIACAADSDDDGNDMGTMLLTRISEGQYTPKIFSERAICRSIINDLKGLPEDCGTVLGVVELPAIERSRE